MSTQIKSLLLAGTPVLVAIILSIWLQVVFFSNPQQFTAWLKSFGPLLIIVYILLQWLTIIIAPLGGMVLQIAVLAVFGPAIGYLIIYLVATPAFCINFLLAKRYGRNFVLKVMGKKAMVKFDHYMADAGVSTLIVLKMLLGGTFDYIAYVAGLTKITFKQFAMVNFIVGIPGTLVSYFLFTRFRDFTTAVVASIVFAYLLAGIWIVFNHEREKRRKLGKEQSPRRSAKRASR